MTHAIMHAHCLRGVLHSHIEEYPLSDMNGLSLKYQQAASVVSNTFWAGVEPNDLQWPTTEGERTK